MSETRADRLHEDIREIRAVLTGLEPLLVGIQAQFPHLATKTELAALDAKLSAALADKPSRGYLWGVMAAMVGAQAVALAAAGMISSKIQRPAELMLVPKPHASATGIVLAAELGALHVVARSMTLLRVGGLPVPTMMSTMSTP